MSTKLFETYLKGLSQHRPKEFKLVVIDNAGFHSTKNMTVPPNIFLLNIPAYSPELNPCEQVWAYMKTRFKDKVFTTLKDLKEWLYESVKNWSEATILSITSNPHFLNEFNAVFKMQIGIKDEIFNSSLKSIFTKFHTAFIPLLVSLRIIIMEIIQGYLQFQFAG